MVASGLPETNGKPRPPPPTSLRNSAPRDVMMQYVTSPGRGRGRRTSDVNDTESRLLVIDVEPRLSLRKTIPSRDETLKKRVRTEYTLYRDFR